jgi:hypothetical protein
VSAEDALARLSLVDPVLMSGVSDQIQGTLDRRNLMAHMGLFARPSDEELLDHVAAFVRAIEGLLLIDATTFWDDQAALAAELVKEQLNKVAIRVQTRIVEAKSHIESMDPDRRDALVEQARAWLEADSRPADEVDVECPACFSTGEGFGDLEDDGEPYFERGEPVGWIPDIKSILTGFRCRVCGLHLNSAEEIHAARLPQEVDNERATEEDLHERIWDDR